MQNVVGDGLAVGITGYSKRKLLKRPIVIFLDMPGGNMVSVIDFDQENAAGFSKFTDICDLDRARIERPIFDLIMLVRMTKTDVISYRFEFPQRVERKSGDRS